jgi:hypothetical protein
MSADFSKVLVKDDRLDVCDNIKYGVIKGGQNVTAAQYQAISKSNNQLVFNIQVPSEQTLIDRRVLLQADFTIKVTSSGATWTNAAPPVVTPVAPANGCGYGQFASLASFPLHRMMTVASATINNNTVSVNIRDVLPAIERLLEERELSSYNGTTPSFTDPLFSYSDGIQSVNNPLAGQYTSADQDFNGRGSIALTGYTKVDVGTTSVENFTFHISEPLMISPFIYSNPKSNGQAFYGIQNMNIVLNIGGLERAFRGLSGINGLNMDNTVNAAALYPSPAGIVTVGTAGASLPSIVSVAAGDAGLFSSARLLFMFLTPHPSDLMPARNIVPFYELPRYITASPLSGSIPALSAGAVVAAGNTVVPYTTTGGSTLVSQTLQLNQIPDKLIIFARKQSQSYGDSDSFLPIRGININFNNNSGILASATCEDLYRMSKDNGSVQNWQQWLGLANTLVGPALNGTTAASPSGLFSGPVSVLAQAGSTARGFKSVSTCGSLLVLEFGHDIQLVEDFFAPGSLGNFNIQVQLRCDNQMNASVGNQAGDIPIELVMITMNSGVFVCERGTSSTYTGILTRADVLEASEQDPYTRSDVQRMVGGGFLDMIKSGVRKLAPIAKEAAKAALPHVAKYVQGKMGDGRSGGGVAGGLAGRYH